MNRKDWHFVVYGYEIDYFNVMFADAVSEGNVEYVSNPVLYYSGSSLLSGLQKFCEHGRLKKVHHLDGLGMWRRWQIGDYGEGFKQLCFVFLMRWLKPENEQIFKLIRQRYPEAKIAVYLEDLYETGKNLDYTIADRYANLIISYDRNDADAHGFLYYPTFLSAVDIQDAGSLPGSDVMFCGAAKKRYDSIIQSYKVFKEAGLRCDFMVSRLLPGQNKIAGIDYIKYLISYKDYLRHVMRSDFILEIMQGNATGYTLRTWEAILYDKVLLTDNKAILKAPFYNKDQFIYFEKPEDIDFNSIPRKVSHNSYARELSPVKFFDFIISKIG